MLCVALLAGATRAAAADARRRAASIAPRVSGLLSWPLLTAVSAELAAPPVLAQPRVVGCTLTVRADRSRVYVASSTARTSGKDFTAWAHAPRKIHADPATRIRRPLVDGTEDASTACFAACQFNKTGFARFWLAWSACLLGPSRVQRGPVAALNWLRQYQEPAAGAKLCSRRGARTRGSHIGRAAGGPALRPRPR